jgi:hypothetical protein
MSDSFPYISGAYLGWQIGNVILGKPIDPGMVIAGVAIGGLGLAIGLVKAWRRA